MNPLRVVHTDKKAIALQQDEAFEKWSKQLLDETIAQDIKKAEKKYKKNLDHLRLKYNVQ